MAWRKWLHEHYLPNVTWRGWHLSPLFTWGRFTAFFTSGVSFGIKYSSGGKTFYVGPAIVMMKTKQNEDFVKRINDGTWPQGWMIHIKYANFGNVRGKWFWEVN